MKAERSAQQQRWLDHDAWFTPGDCAEQVMRGARDLGVEPESIVDLGAGPGGWLQRANFVWPRAHRTAIEIRPEERPHLERWAHTIHIADFRTVQLPRRVDLIVGNFAFSELCPKLHWSFARARWVLTLVPAGFGAAEGAEQLLQLRPPQHSLRLAGRISFMNGATDFQHHEALLWDTDSQSGDQWCTHPLALLPWSSRRWIIRPGEESSPRPLSRAFYPSLRRRAA